MYKWKKITSDFDRSIPFTKIKWNNNFNDYVTNGDDGYFAESPNVNTDGMYWNDVDTQQYAYAGNNRFSMIHKYFSNRVGGFTDVKWNNTSKTTDLGNGYYQYTSPKTLYWSGLYNPVNYSVVGNAVEVWVDVYDFKLSTSALTFTSEASSSTVTVISSENPWTASTVDSWITLSQSTGNTGETTITVSVSSTIFSDRTGTVSFTDGENIAELTVNQKKNASVRLKNLYLENTRIDKMYCNGDLIYQSLTKPIFSLSTNELEIETGQTGTFDITANDRWTITAPEWLTVSQNSGYGNATITVTMGSVESAGTINVTCYNQTKSISVTTQIDYSKKYLTFDILSDGYVNWMYNNNSTIHNTIEYRKNGGSWSAITATAAGVHIDVVTGDLVEFRGNNATYSSSSARYGMFQGTTCNFNVKGNIMSLINSTNFQTLKTFTESYNFRALFFTCITLLDASKLVLPATLLATGSYRYMFQDCSNLTKAPELPATTLTNECYYGMFARCSVLNYVKCLATSGINTNSSTQGWLDSVSSTGSFVKKSGITWPRNANGIPRGWTVEEV